MGHITSLALRNVTRRFGNISALYEFDLDIVGGQFVTLLGPSGCGKTTALNCLAGFLDLTSGEILLNGEPIHHLPPEKRGFGMVFQNYALFPHMTAARNVGYGLGVRHLPSAERNQRVHLALQMVHLEELSKRYPAQLSGGQQQRLAIARTIVLDPNVLLLDEPLSNLDANLRAEMRFEIKRIHSALGLTTIYVTHDQSEAMTMSDVVVVMRMGHIEQVGTPQEIFIRPRNSYVAKFMGYSNRLSATVLGKEKDGWRVQTEMGLQLVGTITGTRNLRIGEKVIICFRPDETLAELASTVNTMSGTIQFVEYTGKGFEAVIASKEADAQLIIHSTDQLTDGNPVEFGVRPERLLVFSLDEDTPYPQMYKPSSGAMPDLLERR
jgi:putative spermidine/putrescine transport system ATP-binding protein